MNAVLNGGISPGVRAARYNASIAPLVEVSGALLVVDPGQSTPNRTVSRGNIPAATILPGQLDIRMGALGIEDDDDD